ncbi:MAG: hypothetical protein LW823_09235 [Rickettsiales bacterium]|jgi:hypothetical protein|nr:hypothetical protein [Rickettsiales bacterium]
MINSRKIFKYCILSTAFGFLSICSASIPAQAKSVPVGSGDVEASAIVKSGDVKARAIVKGDTCSLNEQIQALAAKSSANKSESSSDTRPDWTGTCEGDYRDCGGDSQNTANFMCQNFDINAKCPDGYKFKHRDNKSRTCKCPTTAPFQPALCTPIT